MPARRAFFRQLAEETRSFLEEVRGLPQRQLNELPQLPDAALQDLVPALAEGVSLSYRDGQVVARVGEQVACTLFAAASHEMRVFGCIDGRRSLAAICRQLGGHEAGDDGWSEAFAPVRACFLKLVRAGVCVPANFVD